MSDRMTLTIDEAAQALGVSRNLTYELARDGRLPVVRLGRRILVPRAALEQLLAGAAPMPGARQETGR